MPLDQDDSDGAIAAIEGLGRDLVAQLAAEFDTARQTIREFYRKSSQRKDTIKSLRAENVELKTRISYLEAELAKIYSFFDSMKPKVSEPSESGPLSGVEPNRTPPELVCRRPSSLQHLEKTVSTSVCENVVNFVDSSSTSDSDCQIDSVAVAEPSKDLSKKRRLAAAAIRMAQSVRQPDSAPASSQQHSHSSSPLERGKSLIPTPKHRKAVDELPSAWVPVGIKPKSRPLLPKRPSKDYFPREGPVENTPDEYWTLEPCRFSESSLKRWKEIEQKKSDKF